MQNKRLLTEALAATRAGKLDIILLEELYDIIIKRKKVDILKNPEYFGSKLISTFSIPVIDEQEKEMTKTIKYLLRKLPNVKTEHCDDMIYIAMRYAATHEVLDVGFGVEGRNVRKTALIYNSEQNKVNVVKL
eukprot:UN30922